MTTTFTAEQKPADIVKVFPKASDLFKSHQIDFCCQGDQPLATVFKEQNLNDTAIMAELNTMYDAWAEENQDLIDWEAAPLSDLVDHIVSTHHTYLYDELPALDQFVNKVFFRHGDTQPHLLELKRLYTAFKAEMEEHTAKEEHEVFPLIKQYDKQPDESLRSRIIEANGGLEDDHDKAGSLLKQMRQVTNGFQPPEGACNTYRITYARLAELEDDTFKHVHLENHILFKRIQHQ